MDAPPGGNNNTSRNSNNPGSKARAFAGQWAASAGQAVQQWTARKYTLPDKNVASQVLMYRQLLHTKCRPGLKLSREYQGTPAQKAVLHMPWWSKGIEQTQKMEIAYDNLIRRLWLHGAILPPGSDENAANLDTLLDEQGMPPVPHEFWVSRLGFQQKDPVTDFRSGGVLSLAMLVWVVESCPKVFSRFVRPIGDASVLPFGITSINITDMMAKFLMLAKGVDRMDALLSQKPFWRMFADPNSLLACQELSMDLLADVVVELRTIRETQAKLDAAISDDEDLSDSPAPEPQETVTVFDFAHILAVTEKRVEHDLLGAGPGSVTELRAIHQRLKVRYKQQLEQKLQRMTNEAVKTPKAPPDVKQVQQVATKQLQNLQQQATGLGAAASSFAGNVFTKIKSPGFNPLRRNSQQQTESEAVIFDSKQEAVETPKAADTAVEVQATEGDWAGTDIPAATEQIGNFSIGDDDDANFSIGDDDED